MQHHFDVDIATKYGILEAVLLNHFEHWIRHNEANNTNFHDGTYWTYNSVKALKELFPYVSERKIRYAIDRLKDMGLIKTGNFNSVAYDRTTWFAFTDKGKSLMQKCQMDSVNLSNGFGKNVEPIPDNNTDIYISIKERKRKKEFTPPTLEEVTAYVSERHSNVDPKYFYDYFTAGEWIDSEGKPVKNWKQKLISWEGRKNNGKPISSTVAESAEDKCKKWNITYDVE